jgi:hypothetical protein
MQHGTQNAVISSPFILLEQQIRRRWKTSSTETHAVVQSNHAGPSNQTAKSFSEETPQE